MDKTFVPIDCVKCFAWIQDKHYHCKGTYQGNYCSRCYQQITDPTGPSSHIRNHYEFTPCDKNMETIYHQIILVEM